MENKDEMKTLDDELLDQVSGGHDAGLYGADSVTCPYCRREFIIDSTTRRRWFDDHVEKCEKTYGSQTGRAYGRNGMNA